MIGYKNSHNISDHKNKKILAVSRSRIDPNKGTLETHYVLNGKHLRQDQDRNEMRVYFVRMRLGMEKIRGRGKRDL